MLGTVSRIPDPFVVSEPPVIVNPPPIVDFAATVSEPPVIDSGSLDVMERID